MLEKVVFSERAIIALLSETQEHIKTEPAVYFLGIAVATFGILSKQLIRVSTAFSGLPTLNTMMFT